MLVLLEEAQNVGATKIVRVSPAKVKAALENVRGGDGKVEGALDDPNFEVSFRSELTAVRMMRHLTYLMSVCVSGTIRFFQGERSVS